MANMEQLTATLSELVEALRANAQTEASATTQAPPAVSTSTALAPVKLNIGGTRFETSTSTLHSEGHSFFDSMLSGRWDLHRCADGSYFIDRDPAMFPHILNYLRGIEPELEHLSQAQISVLHREADYYGLAGLVNLLDTARLSTFVLGPGPNYTLDTDQRTARKTGGSSDWDATVLGPQLETGVPVMVRYVAGSGLMVGAAPSDVNQTLADNHRVCGLYINTYDGNLFAGDGTRNRQYSGSGKISLGSTIAVLLDAARNLSFLVNGSDRGPAYTVPAHMLPLRLCVLMCAPASQVQLMVP